MTVKPRQPAPALEVKLLDGSTWRLADARPATFEMVVVYRGLHCPICKTYLGELEAKLPEFSKRGVHVIAVSTDSRERAERVTAEWGLSNLRVGCELSAHVHGTCSFRARSATASRRNSASRDCF
jgi:peroxiredoxin